MAKLLEGRIGIALGSGAARGWAHIGVLRALEERGISPEIVCGASAGAVVGAAYAAGRLDAFEGWVRQLQRSDVARNVEISLRGGLIRPARFFEYMSAVMPDQPIGSLPRAFGAVATDLASGREIWLRDGSLHEALKASVAMPGLILPARRGDRWLVDGGLVNPVPVSLCRAMGADSVIAVDLNTTLLRRRSLDAVRARVEPAAAEDEVEPQDDAAEAADSADVAAEVGVTARGERTLDGLTAAVQEWAGELRERLFGETEVPSPATPSLYDVLANSINIMQVRVTRSRLAGDPAELLVTPRLADFALLDLDRGEEAIEEGERALVRALASSQ